MPTGVQQFQLNKGEGLLSDAARKSGVALVFLTTTVLLTGCVASVAPEPKKQVSKAKTFEEVKKAPINDQTKFSSKDYGVEASARVTTEMRPRKGGGRYQIGKPYQIKGRWYHPELDKNLREKGLASWYGPNFHGRLTANGEIYDQFALTAAHPTMPLPSYAKVTNLENGRKITVRVNDRGPFAPNRVIDLSARAAKLLGYDRQGLAKVKVEYVGEAPLHGRDEAMLMASYIGPKGTDTGAPRGGSSSGTMIALAEPKLPSAPVSAIEQGFGTADLAFVTANAVVPIPRPTLFEGIALGGGETVDYSVAPLPGSEVSGNTLSYAGGEMAGILADYQKVRIDYPWANDGETILLDAGNLDKGASKLAFALLSDLDARAVDQTSATVFSVAQADANSALERLRQAGLKKAQLR